MNQINVLYDYQIFSLQQYGGVSRYIKELSSQIAKDKKFNIRIIAPLHINKYLKGCSFSSGYSLPYAYGIKRVLIPINQTIFKFYSSQCSSHIVHETYYSRQRTGTKKSKIVLTIHDMIHEKFADLLSEKEQISPIKASAIHRADHIICVSENTKKDLLELFDINHEKISVIYLGYSLCSDKKLQKKPIKLLKPYILFVGQRWEHKNFSRLLIAYASSTSIKDNFDLICFGGSSFSQQELNRFSELNVSLESIKQISGSDHTLASLYANASAFVYPSLYEGFGIPLLEAMSFNCPVVCSNTSSIPEVVGNAAEFFDPYEPEDIVKALEKVLYSLENAQKLISYGKERIKQFSWEKCAEETKQVYLSLL